MVWYGMVEVCEGAPVAVSGWVLTDRHDVRPCAVSSLLRVMMCVNVSIGKELSQVGKKKKLQEIKAARRESSKAASTDPEAFVSLRSVQLSSALASEGTPSGTTTDVRTHCAYRPKAAR